MRGEPAIAARGLRKAFGDVRALDGVDLEVERGTVTTLLGPNGAGKTTTLRILTTLLRLDSGTARVAGHDVVAEAGAVRRRIAVTAQETTVDRRLTGRENLELVGRLRHLGRPGARVRAHELLDRFALLDAADRLVATWSGGMRRRLDLAASLVGKPDVLFLDEPTTGLDAASRHGIWDVVEELTALGTTIVLSTQELAEADALSHRVAVLAGGRVIAEGAVAELKARAGSERVDLTLERRDHVPRAREIVARHAAGEPRHHAQAASVVAPVADGMHALAAILSDLDAAGVRVTEIGVRRPTLDEVVVSLAGGPAAAGAEPVRAAL